MTALKWQWKSFCAWGRGGEFSPEHEKLQLKGCSIRKFENHCSSRCKRSLALGRRYGRRCMTLSQMPRRGSEADNSSGERTQGRQIVEIRGMRSYFLGVRKTWFEGNEGIVRDPCARWDGAALKGWVTEGVEDCLQHCLSALMMRNQIVVGGSGEGEAAASTYCLFEKYVRKYKVKIDRWLVGH